MLLVRHFGAPLFQQLTLTMPVQQVFPQRKLPRTAIPLFVPGNLLEQAPTERAGAGLVLTGHKRGHGAE